MDVGTQVSPLLVSSITGLNNGFRNSVLPGREGRGEQMKKIKISTVILAALAGFVIPHMGCGGSSDYEVLPKLLQSGCSSDSECSPGFFCNLQTGMHVCLPNHCRDSQKDGQETCTDGGGDCRPAYLCPNGQGCNVDGDCASNKCTNGVCVGLPDGSACTDGHQCANGNCVGGFCGGTPNNCGGSCPTGQVCNTSTNTCVTPPSNNCGGVTCPTGQICGATNTCVTPGPTQPGGSCTQNSQCLSGLCQSGFCAPPPFSWKVPAGTTCDFYNAVSSTPVAARTSIDANTPVPSSPSNLETGSTCRTGTTSGCTFQTYCTNGFVPCRLGTGGVPTVGWNFCQ